MNEIYVSGARTKSFWTTVASLRNYRELILTLTWRNILVAYKQSYLGLGWAILKPVLLMLIFTLVKSFVGIDSGKIPYPILTFAALMPWLLFQDATAQSINSITANAGLIRKIYFPREVFPLTAIAARIVDLAISFLILSGLMVYYRMAPTAQVLWIPFLIVYTLMASLAIGLLGAAFNVYYRDISKGLPVALNLLLYASPVIYPLSLVHRTLIENQAVGAWSDALYWLYLLNPLAGIIDGWQKALLQAQSPNIYALLPGLVLVAITLPVSYRLFKRAETHFADVI